MSQFINNLDNAELSEAERKLTVSSVRMVTTMDEKSELYIACSKNPSILQKLVNLLSMQQISLISKAEGLWSLVNLITISDLAEVFLNKL